MCDQCSNKSHRAPSAVTRRGFLLMGSAIAAAVVAAWNSRDLRHLAQPTTPTPPAPPKPFAQSTQFTTHPTTQLADATAPATTPSTSTAATGPAPDLGAALFPDANGKPIASAADAPVIIIPRANWTSIKPNLNDIVTMNGINKITIHHTAGATQTDAWLPTVGILEGIREFHAGTMPADRQWADIAYHFAIDRAGRVWQARPLAYQGAHVKGHNEHNLGIVLLGNFDTQSPAAAQLWSLATFIPFLQFLYKVPANQIFTHGELGQTSCPGKNLQTYMNRMRKTLA